MSEHEDIDPGEDVKAYVTSYVWLRQRDEELAEQFRSDTLEWVSPEEWNAACDVLWEYAERKAQGIPPDFTSARIVMKPDTIGRPGDPRGGEFTWKLMPARTGTCSQCGVVHDPEEPHNQQSLYWQYAFYAEHQRWPTWADAMAHCTREVQEAWRLQLREHGIQV